jgi:hypothetical protein
MAGAALPLIIRTLPNEAVGIANMHDAQFECINAGAGAGNAKALACRGAATLNAKP